MFIDYTKIKCFAGKGGPGAATFRREKFIPKGGPDGGDGGHGGNIIVQVKPDLHTLHDIRYNKIYRAKNGASGGSSRKTGKNGVKKRANWHEMAKKTQKFAKKYKK